MSIYAYSPTVFWQAKGENDTGHLHGCPFLWYCNDGAGHLALKVRCGGVWQDVVGYGAATVADGSAEGFSSPRYPLLITLRKLIRTNSPISKPLHL
jgi:hypothetical protein